MSRLLRLVLLVVLMIALLIAASGLYRSLTDEIDVSSVSQEAVQEETDRTETEDEEREEVPTTPDFTVYDGDGNPVSLSEMSGTPVVLNFWASWCPPCKAELPDFDEACRNNPEVRFMMINLTDGGQETRETARTFIDEYGYGFPVYFDEDTDAADTYGVTAIPTTVFIGKDGTISSIYVGKMSAQALEEELSKIR